MDTTIASFFNENSISFNVASFFNENSISFNVADSLIHPFLHA